MQLHILHPDHFQPVFVGSSYSFVCDSCMHEFDLVIFISHLYCVVFIHFSDTEPQYQRKNSDCIWLFLFSSVFS